MQNDYIFCQWDSLIMSYNWQDSVTTMAMMTENNSHVADSTIMRVDLDYLLLWLFVYVVIMMLLLFMPNGKIIHRKD